jgi:hypothetical protein
MLACSAEIGNEVERPFGLVQTTAVVKHPHMIVLVRTRTGRSPVLAK